MIAEKAKIQKVQGEMPTKTRGVYIMRPSINEGTGISKMVLGGKGKGNSLMMEHGIMVPSCYTLSTKECHRFFENSDGKLDSELKEIVNESIYSIGDDFNLEFGNPERVFVASVRSGAPLSMPGQLKTVLNVGLNDIYVEGLAKLMRNRSAALACYARLIQMYAETVHGIHENVSEFDAILVNIGKKTNKRFLNDLTELQLEEAVKQYKDYFLSATGQEFPQDPYVQLYSCIEAVFKSWNSDQAKAYRKEEKISDDLGTAVTVQAMVFGNFGKTSGTGVLFSRNPDTGAKGLYGEFLIDAQGEEVVNGSRTPQKIHELKDILPQSYIDLESATMMCEQFFKDMVDVEFTIQEGKVWMLQVREGKRTGSAAFQIACDLVDEGLITREEALLKISPDHINYILQDIFDPQELKKAIADKKAVAHSSNGSPGAACGQIVFTQEDAIIWRKKGRKVVLVRHDTNPADYIGMMSSQAVISGVGGSTCHAMLVARGKGKTTLAGFKDMTINYAEKTVQFGSRVFNEGDWISVDGRGLTIFEGQITTIESNIKLIYSGVGGDTQADDYKNFVRILDWAKEIKRMSVKTNADNAKDARIAFAFGAEGIGLYRTEHTLEDAESLRLLQLVFASKNKEQRVKYLNLLEPLQAKNLYETFLEAKSRPIRQRTIDSPIEEFTPKHSDPEYAKIIAEIAKELGHTQHEVETRFTELKSANPDISIRGCRLTIMYPEILEMQVSSMALAMEMAREKGVEPNLEIMIPNVVFAGEAKWHFDKINEQFKKFNESQSSSLTYHLACMIETGNMIAETAQVIKKTGCTDFSYGTNDMMSSLLLMARGMQLYIESLIELNIVSSDPFIVLQASALYLIELCEKLARLENENYKSTVCGEAGSNRESIISLDKIGIDGVSVSAYLVPGAIIFAAQAAIINK